MPEKVLDLFDQMKCKPDAVIVTVFFNACSKLVNDQTKKRAKEVLDRLPKGFLKNTISMNSAIDMLMRFGDVNGAEDLFETISKPDVMTYGAMINGYKINHEAKKCLSLFQRIEKDKIVFSAPLCVSLIGVCAQIGLVSTCHRVTNRIPSNFYKNLTVASCLIDMWVRNILPGRLLESIRI